MLPSQGFPNGVDSQRDGQNNQNWGETVEGQANFLGKGDDTPSPPNRGNPVSCDLWACASTPVNREQSEQDFYREKSSIQSNFPQAASASIMRSKLHKGLRNFWHTCLKKFRGWIFLDKKLTWILHWFVAASLYLSGLLFCFFGFFSSAGFSYSRSKFLLPLKTNDRKERYWIFNSKILSLME